MAKGHDQNNKAIIMYVANDPVVSYAIPPERRKRSFQPLAKFTRVFKDRKPVLEKIADTVAGLRI
jgi:hypothetical protein